MKNLFLAYKYFWILLAVLSVIIVFSIFKVLNVPEKLPIYQPAQISASLVDEKLQHITRNHKIAPFNLINQNGDSISHLNYKNKIYIASFFFTTCPSICPKMTQNMHLIQEHIVKDNEVLLLSHSVTPQIDTVAQLKRYALKNGIIDAKWNLVTGNKKQIYNLARKSYLVVQDDGDGGPYDMIHTENFVLVDKKKQIRGIYDGTDSKAIETLLKDLKILKLEYKN